MCKCLNISRSSYYSYKDNQVKENELNDMVAKIFYENQRVYGTRKIKAVLLREGIRTSRRRIARTMRQNGLVSAYTKKTYKPTKSTVNPTSTQNLVNREFDEREKREVIVSDLTYVRVNHKWNYICVLLDLHNREFIGYSCGEHKDALLVMKAFESVKGSLRDIQVFHSDRGSEFDNYLIDELIENNYIMRSLSKRGCPYDNAVAEAHFKIIKTEFVQRRNFASLDELRLEFAAYVHWFNNIRLHSSLGYKSPKEFCSSLL